MLLWLLLSISHAEPEKCANHYEVTTGKVEFIKGEKHELVVRANAESFAPLPPVQNCSDNIYGRDDSFVYLNGKIVENAEPKGFFVETVDDRYTHDEKHAFWKGKQISQATGKGFRAVAPGYARDTNRAFFQELAIPEADPKTLASAGQGFVRDENRVFLETEAFPISQLHLFGVYARLGNKVLYHQTVLPGADAETFDALGDCFARDKTSVWVRSSRWPEAKRDEVTELEPDALLKEACRNSDPAFCCAKKGANLLAVVRDRKSGGYRTLDVPMSEIQALPGGILKTKTWTFKNLVEQP